MSDSLVINKVKIEPGETKLINLNVARLYDYTEMKIPIKVIRGKKPGPCLFVCAAIHGDEINGVEIIRRLLHCASLKKMKGTLIAVPIVNVFGFNAKSRYLPDRRDLNRSFPGSKQGSLASRLAHVFMKEVVAHATHGIDLHTGAVHRKNLPQVRASFDNPEAKALAHVFGTPVVINSSIRDGSLREAAGDKGIPLLLYEGGQALYFDEPTIKIGLAGIQSVMRAIGMLPKIKQKKHPKPTFTALSSHWVRAPFSGILKNQTKLGAHVKQNELLGIVSDPMGVHQHPVKAKHTGIIIGLNELPLVNRGDALFHIAMFEDAGMVEETFEQHDDFQEFV